MNKIVIWLLFFHCSKGLLQWFTAYDTASVIFLGAFNYLKENFSNAPSLDMSAPSLSMLVRLMVAQVQECVFERTTITTQDTKFTSQLQLAQEAAQVT